MNRRYIIIAIIFLASGILIGRFMRDGSAQSQPEETKQIRQSGYAFVNPLLECEIEGENSLKKYVPFEKKAKSRITAEVIEKNPNTHLSVYFRNLNNGPWFGINEKENFSPASLLKVPLMMAYLKESETNPEILNEQIVFNEKINYIAPLVKPEEEIEMGKTYSVQDLIFRMIAYSDNNAMQLLYDNISKDNLDKVYRDLGISVLNVRTPNDFMSVKEYASFFRILYNAAYLKDETSERALEILSKAGFKKGLVAGVPDNIVISHKFGERELEGNMKKQLHDCGIIYYPAYPYLLCVMTRGNDMNNLSEIIAQTSKIVFEEISANYPVK